MEDLPIVNQNKDDLIFGSHWCVQTSENFKALKAVGFSLGTFADLPYMSVHGGEHIILNDKKPMDRKEMVLTSEDNGETFKFVPIPTKVYEFDTAGWEEEIAKLPRQNQEFIQYFSLEVSGILEYQWGNLTQIADKPRNLLEKFEAKEFWDLVFHTQSRMSMFKEELPTPYYEAISELNANLREVSTHAGLDGIKLKRVDEVQVNKLDTSGMIEVAADVEVPFLRMALTLNYKLYVLTTGAELSTGEDKTLVTIDDPSKGITHLPISEALQGFLECNTLFMKIEEYNNFRMSLEKQDQELPDSEDVETKLRAFVKDLDTLKWMGDDPGWDSAVEAIKKELNGILGVPSDLIGK